MPRVFVITGPSGVGKGTLIRTLRERMPDLALSTSATTRLPRPGETQGEHYHFLSDEQFEEKVSAGEFVEHAQYTGRRYGTLRAELEKHTSAGRPVILEIEVQGARQVAETMPDAVRIFIAPPTDDVLRTRLIGRGDTTEDMDARLETAQSELAAREDFDEVVVNDRLDEAADRLEELIRSYTSEQ